MRKMSKSEIRFDFVKPEKSYTFTLDRNEQSSPGMIKKKGFNENTKDLIK